MSTRRSKTIFRYAMRLEAQHYGKQYIYPPAIRASLRLCYPPKRTTQEERETRHLHRLTQSHEATGDINKYDREHPGVWRKLAGNNKEDW